MSEDFRTRLARRQSQIDSFLCVGLDPLPEKLPIHIEKAAPNLAIAITQWMCGIVDATAPFASMYKPQKAHYEAFPGGRWTLQQVVAHIRLNYPDIPVFLDCKRGDIGRTQQRYRIAQFEIDGVDGMNFSPYMGKACMSSLVDSNHLHRAIVGLCYTSNPEARQVQDIVIQDGRQYWEFMAQCILEWAMELGVEKNAGLVMAAAYEKPKGSGEIFSEHLSRCREIVGDKLWFLIPGVGKQGGAKKETVEKANAGEGSFAVSSSSEIDFASDGEDFAEASAGVAEETRDELRKGK